MYIIATQGEGKEQKECVFAWTVLLRNVTRIPKGHHGWTPAKKQGSNLRACSNLNEPELQHISKQVTNPPLYGDPQSGIGDWRSGYAFSFLFLYTATKYKSTDIIYTTKRPVRNCRDSERSWTSEMCTEGTIRIGGLCLGVLIFYKHPTDLK